MSRKHPILGSSNYSNTPSRRMLETLNPEEPSFPPQAIPYKPYLCTHAPHAYPSRLKPPHPHSHNTPHYSPHQTHTHARTHTQTPTSTHPNPRSRHNRLMWVCNPKPRLDNHSQEAFSISVTFLLTRLLVVFSFCSSTPLHLFVSLCVNLKNFFVQVGELL